MTLFGGMVFWTLGCLHKNGKRSRRIRSGYQSDHTYAWASPTSCTTRSKGKEPGSRGGNVTTTSVSELDTTVNASPPTVTVGMVVPNFVPVMVSTSPPANTSKYASFFVEVLSTIHKTLRVQSTRCTHVGSHKLKLPEAFISIKASPPPPPVQLYIVIKCRNMFKKKKITTRRYTFFPTITISKDITAGLVPMKKLFKKLAK